MYRNSLLIDLNKKFFCTLILQELSYIIMAIINIYNLVGSVGEKGVTY